MPVIDVSDKVFTPEQLAGVARNLFLTAWPNSDMHLVCDLACLIDEDAGNSPRFSSREDFDRNEIENRVRLALLADLVQLRVLPLWGIYDRSQARGLARALVSQASAYRAERAAEQKAAERAAVVQLADEKRSA